MSQGSAQLAGAVTQGVQAALDSPTCDVCLVPSDRFLPYRGIRRELLLEVAAFEDRYVWKCRACGHVFCHPKPEPDLLARYYQSYYWESQLASPTLRARLKDSAMGDWAARVRALLSPSSEGREASQFSSLAEPIDQRGGRAWLEEGGSLEIGSGPALFSRLLRRRFGSRFTCDVVEPGDVFGRAFRRHRIRRIARTFEDLGDERGSAGSYKILHGSHWLEHMPDVRAVLRRFRRLLASDGVGYLEVPNCEDPYWAYRYYPDPPHLQFFTPGSLRRLVEDEGFEAVRLDTYGPPLELERELGFLEPTTPVLVSQADLDALTRKRGKKEARLQRSGDRGRVLAEGSPGQNLRVVFQHGPRASRSRLP